MEHTSIPPKQVDNLSSASSGAGLELVRLGVDEQLQFISLINVLLRRRRLLILLTLLGVAVGVGWALTKRRVYTSTVSFMPHVRGGTSQVGAGLAAQLGITLPTTQPAESPAFYTELVKSRSILSGLADEKYAVTPGGAESRGLPELLDVTGKSDRETHERTIRELRNVISATPSQKTGIVTVTVGVGSPILAKQIAQHLLNDLNTFNLVGRQSEAVAERRFTERRLQEAGDNLRQAEDAVEEFEQANRDFLRSAPLRLRHDRLMRVLTLREQLHAALSQSYEQAKIDEVRDTPVITIIEQPIEPLRADSREIVTQAVVGGICGALLAIALAFFNSYVGVLRSRTEPAYREFTTLQDEMVQELIQPWRLFASHKEPGRARSRRDTYPASD